ncbi:hypothetical protein GW17_00048831 [Ensete ventricosum]|nr:hypothetical protein GW17_00048831 [Ensete ventricosum]
MSSVVLTARRAPAGKGCRPCPAYLCQVGRMTADPSMPVSGRLPPTSSVVCSQQYYGSIDTSLLRSGRRLTCIRPGDTVTCFDSSQSASRSPDGLWVGLASHVLTETDRQTDRQKGGDDTKGISIYFCRV